FRARTCAYLCHRNRSTSTSTSSRNHAIPMQQRASPVSRLSMYIVRRALLLAALAAAGPGAAQTSMQEATIRNSLSVRASQIGKIDEIRATPMAGVFEVRVGTNILYSDANGDFLIQGQLIDTRARRNLTEERVGKL